MTYICQQYWHEINNLFLENVWLGNFLEFILFKMFKYIII